jgi:hypothetical protein
MRLVLLGLLLMASAFTKAFLERIGRQVAEECLDYAPWLAEIIIRVGARLLLPAASQQRYIDEWGAHLDDFQRERNAPLATIGCACRIVIAAPRITVQHLLVVLARTATRARSGELAARLVIVVGVALSVLVSTASADGPTLGVGVGLLVVLGSVLAGLAASVPAIALANRLRRRVRS